MDLYFKTPSKGHLEKKEKKWHEKWGWGWVGLGGEPHITLHPRLQRHTGKVLGHAVGLRRADGGGAPHLFCNKKSLSSLNFLA